jgi:diguanylate cyclase (GGDEF)-like protein
VSAERTERAEEALASRVARLARLGRSRVFSEERFERELGAACEGIARAEMLRLLLVEWTGVTIPAEDVPRTWARVTFTFRRLAAAAGKGLSLQTALLHEFHTRLGLVKEPRIVSDHEIAALRVNAITDPLTGLYNRRFLLDHLEREVSRAERAGGVVSVLMMDLAGFKSINDRLGHPVGDGILVRTAKAIRESLRVVDAGCRYGGDEFVAVLPNSDVVHSLAVAERIRHRVGAIRLPLRLGMKVGLNYGVATFPTDGRLLDFLLKMSDIRLYASKRQNGKPFEHARRYPRFAVPGLTLKVGPPKARRPLHAEVQDISFGGMSFVTGAGKTPDRLEGEILQRFSGEPHAIAMRKVSSVALPDGRVRVGCAYVH